MSDLKYGAWTSPEIPVQIKYSLIVIEEIRHEVAQGFQKMARGGIEVGGVLYGRREGDEIQILAVRPIACEHALGPSFQLSAKDRAALGTQLDSAQDEPPLSSTAPHADMAPVGFFVSHTRSEINLSPTDLEIYETYFGGSWQIAMVIRPGRGGAMRAGFFARESDGLVRSERSYLEFNFPDRLAGVLVDRPRVEQRSDLDRRAPRAAIGPAAGPVLARAEPKPQDPLPEPHFTLLDRSIPQGPRRRKWPWLIVWGLVMVALTVIGLRYFLVSSGPEPISLSVLERDGQLQIGWNHTARPVTAAARGTLEISDGGARKLISLTTEDLAKGNFTYQRRTSDVEVRMTVEDQGGEKTQEASRFIGKTGDGDSGRDQESRRDRMEAENERLKKENAAQAQRIQQLETTIKIMQTRSGNQ
jgi:hypothetical protein